MNTSPITSFAEKALAHPMRVFETIIYGYRFSVHFDPSWNLIEAVMSFVPGWGHTHHLYGQTVEELESSVKDEIEKDMAVWPNGGKYPTNYPLCL